MFSSKTRMYLNKYLIKGATCDANYVQNKRQKGNTWHPKPTSPARFQHHICPFSFPSFSCVRAWGFAAYVRVACHVAKLTTLFRKALRQATRHPAQPDAGVRQVSVSISVAAKSPWLRPRPWLCSSQSVRGVLSVSVAFQAQLMRIMSTTTISQSRQTEQQHQLRESTLSWVNICLLFVVWLPAAAWLRLGNTYTSTYIYK